MISYNIFDNTLFALQCACWLKALGFFARCGGRHPGFLGVRVAKAFVDTGKTVVSLGTAHPAKFKETVESALEVSIPIPPALETIMEKQESVRVIPPSKHKVAEEIRKSYLKGN